MQSRATSQLASAWHRLSVAQYDLAVQSEADLHDVRHTPGASATKFGVSQVRPGAQRSNCEGKVKPSQLAPSPTKGTHSAEPASVLRHQALWSQSASLAQGAVVVATQ